MLIFTSTTDPRIASLPPPYQTSILTALHTLSAIAGTEPDPKIHGFVGFIELQDDRDTVNSAIARDLERNLEGAFTDGSCLIGFIAWGNSGDGVTLICPNLPNYATEIIAILTAHL